MAKPSRPLAFMFVCVWVVDGDECIMDGKARTKNGDYLYIILGSLNIYDTFSLMQNFIFFVCWKTFLELKINCKSLS